MSNLDASDRLLRLREPLGSMMRLRSGEFFGGPRRMDQPYDETAPAFRFARALAERDGLPEKTREGARQLVRGTALEGVDGLVERTGEAFSSLLDRWRGEWSGIVGAASGVASWMRLRILPPTNFC